MDEQQTTTDATTQDTGAEVTAQPEEQHAEAVTTTESEPTQTETQATAEEAAQSDYAAWLEKKGIDPTDPEALAKVAQMAQNSEKAMHTKAQTAAELKKQLEASPSAQLDTDNTLVQELFGEVTAIKRSQAIDSFKSEVGLTPDDEQKMVTYLSEHPEKGQLVNAGYLSLSELHALSVGTKVDPKQLKQAGGREALQQLQNKQMASALPGNATTTAYSAPQTDAFRAALLGKS